MSGTERVLPETPATVEEAGVDAVAAVTSGPSAPEGGDWRNRELGLAVRNALTLGTSLTLTWGIALIVRLYVPRLLGPDRFGQLNFADAFSATAFVVLNLGVDTYVRKEISVRPAHASDFLGGIVALRVMLTVIIFAAMEVVLRLTHRSSEARLLVYIYGIGQFFLNGNSTSSGLLHARGSVGGMSVVSVVAKVIWGLGVAVAIFLKLGLWAYAFAYVFSEGLKSAVLFAFARAHLNLRVHIDLRAAWAVIVASAPFFVSTIATTVYNRLDVSILAVKATNREVGWYGAASSLAGLTLLLTPLISWVLMPLFARAAAVSEDELCSMVRRSLELVLVLAIPVALLMALGAKFWIGLLFGAAFAPAAMALRVLSVVFLLMYISIIFWCALTMLNRTWGLTSIFVGGLVVNPTLNFLLITPTLARLGDGGGGAACAMATLGTELAVVGPMFYMLGRRVLDRRLVRVTATCLGVSLFIIILDSLTASQLGSGRLVLDGFVYVVLVFAARAITISDLAGWVQLARRKNEP